MRWVRSGMAAVSLGMVVAAAVGLAASLSFSGGSLGAGTVATGRCTNAGLTVFQNLSGSNVASVTVGAIPSACGGATLLVTVIAGAATGSGSASVPAGGGSVTVAIAGAPAAATAERTDLVLIGP